MILTCKKEQLLKSQISFILLLSVREQGNGIEFMNIRPLTFSKNLKAMGIFDGAWTLDNDVSQANFCFPRCTLTRIQSLDPPFHFKQTEACLFSGLHLPLSYASTSPSLLAVASLFNNFFLQRSNILSLDKSYYTG